MECYISCRWRGGQHPTYKAVGKTDELIEEYKANLPKEIARLESVHANKNPALFKIFKDRKIKFNEEAIKRAASFRKGTNEYDEFIKPAEKNNQYR